MHRSRWFTPSLLLLALLGGAAYLWAQAGAHNPRTDLWDFLNGIQLGGGTVITGTTGAQDSAVVLPTNSVGGTEQSGIRMIAPFCGDGPNQTGTTYLGPALAAFTGDGSDASNGSAACQALDSADEPTADGPLFANVAFKANAMYCLTGQALGAAETNTFTLRSAAANTTPVISCTISTGQTDCRSLTGTTTNIAAGAPAAIKADHVGDNNGDDFKCYVDISLQ
jgi:hypothetical protein